MSSCKWKWGNSTFTMFHASVYSSLRRAGPSILGLFHQAVVALVVPAREALRVVTLGVQVALENAIRIEAIAVASDMAVKIALFRVSRRGTSSRGLRSP